MASRDHSIGEWQGPMWNDCGVCNWMRRAHETRKCCALCTENSAAALAILASNLAIGAGLCAAFEQGRRNGYDEACEGEGYRRFYRDSEWEPGCALDEAIDQATAERDAAYAALDELMARVSCNTLVSDIPPKLIDVMRVRYGREVNQWRHNHDQRKTERDFALAALDGIKSKRGVERALKTRALSLLAAVRRLVDSRGYATAEDQAVMREADAFLAEQGVVVRAEPVVPERLAYRDGRAPETKGER